MITLISFASCEKSDNTEDSMSTMEETANQDDNDHDLSTVADYKLIYESNGDGTCNVVGIWMSPDSKNATVNIPALSPDGERVISCNISCQPIPRLIPKDVFESEISAKLWEAVESGAITEFDCKKIMAYFTFVDGENTNGDQEFIDKIHAEYPITKDAPFYVFCDDASPREIEVLTNNFSKHTAFFEASSYLESARLSNNGENIYPFCMFDAITKIILENGIQTVESLSNHRKATDIVLPESISRIGGGGFCFCSSLKNINIPSNISAIYGAAFTGCDTLVETENGISYVNNWAIAYDGVTENVIIRANTYGFANGLFSNKSKLKSVEMPDSLKIICEGAFTYCRNLTTVVIGNQVTTIGNCVFMKCENLTRVEIPKSVTSIGASVFSGCSNLTDISYSGSEDEWNAVEKPDQWDFGMADYTITFLG